MSSSVGAQIIRNLSPRQKEDVRDTAIKLAMRLNRVYDKLCPECRKLIKENVTDCL